MGSTARFRGDALLFALFSAFLLSVAILIPGDVGSGRDESDDEDDADDDDDDDDDDDEDDEDDSACRLGVAAAAAAGRRDVRTETLLLLSPATRVREVTAEALLLRCPDTRARELAVPRIAPA